jgi:hypothetical protein
MFIWLSPWVKVPYLTGSGAELQPGKPCFSEMNLRIHHLCHRWFRRFRRIA